MSMEVHPLKLCKIFDAPYWFCIPSYQRPYRWGKDEILDLLDDINDARINAHGDENAEYFLGAIVLRRRSTLINDGVTPPKYRDEYEVLDGQQRLTSLFLSLEGEAHIRSKHARKKNSATTIEKLVIELDGSQHYETAGLDYDARRTAFLNRQGILVLRCSDRDVFKNFSGVCEEIDRVVRQRVWEK